MRAKVSDGGFWVARYLTLGPRKPAALVSVPGNYRVLVIQGFEEHLWGSPELAAGLKPQSIAFEVHESETKELVVPVISSDEWPRLE